MQKIEPNLPYFVRFTDGRVHEMYGNVLLCWLDHYPEEIEEIEFNYRYDGTMI